MNDEDGSQANRGPQAPVDVAEPDQALNAPMPAMTKEFAGPQPEPGPPGSVEAWFAILETPLLHYTMKLVHDHETSQDIVQEAFLKLHARFEEVRDPRPWLYRTAHNLALNHLRSGKKILPLPFPEDGPDPAQITDDGPLPHEQLERREAVEQARLCLRDLDERSAELVRLKFGEGLSYKEISLRTGLSVSNVGYLLHHALKDLAAALEQSGVTL